MVTTTGGWLQLVVGYNNWRLVTTTGAQLQLLDLMKNGNDDNAEKSFSDA